MQSKPMTLKQFFKVGGLNYLIISQVHTDLQHINFYMFCGVLCFYASILCRRQNGMILV